MSAPGRTSILSTAAAPLPPRPLPPRRSSPGHGERFCFGPRPLHYGSATALVAVLAGGFATALSTRAADATPASSSSSSSSSATPELPPAAAREVSFSADVLPLFERSCLRCHGAVKPKAGLRLDNLEAALKGGDQGPVIKPGDGAQSALIRSVARVDADSAMPPEGKGDPLTPAEVGLLRAWIDQGAHGSPGGAEATAFAASATPSVHFISVNGNAARFREHTGLQEGWGGGLQEFSLRYDTDPRTHVALDGRALYSPDDYRFNARISRDDLGWFRLGYREFSRFHDDTGGYYAPFGTPAPRLGEDLVLRERHATAEVGLELPDWPTIRLTYDLRLRDGSEDTLLWGGITDDTITRNIFPGRKRVDETTHLVTLDIRYDWDGLQIADQAQFEWHAQDNQRTNFEFANGAFPYATAVTDRQDYWRGANTLRLERNIRDWWYVSGGYLFSHLRDEGGFGVESFVPNDPTTPPSLDRTADDITLRRQSHVINGNTMLGPWEHLQAYAGLQAEWTRQEGFATGRTFTQATRFDANVDRASTDENFGLRYDGLPATVLFAETQFQQASYSHFEEGLTDGAQEFLRDTDAEDDTKAYEAGFTIAPWRVASLTTKYRHRDRRNDYRHPRDLDVFSSGNGYPAFIRDRRTDGDEIDSRLVLQPLRWLKTTLRYSYSTTDFETTTDSYEDLTQFPSVVYPGGTVHAGTYDSHAFSAGFVFTPWRRLYLASTVGWVTSRSRSGLDNGLEVVPYEGDTWSILSSATLVVDEKTDLLATHVFSRADFSQNNAAAGLPLGIEYSRHAATAGIARRMKHDRTLKLEYGYFVYDEPTLGGAADYSAHAVFASLHIPWK